MHADAPSIVLLRKLQYVFDRVTLTIEGLVEGTLCRAFQSSNSQIYFFIFSNFIFLFMHIRIKSVLVRKLKENADRKKTGSAVEGIPTTCNGKLEQASQLIKSFYCQYFF